MTLSFRFLQQTLRAALLLCLLGGCEAAVEEELDEASANAIVVALHDAEIGARKEAAEGDGERYRVLVPADDVADALRTLRAEGLPRETDNGFDEVFGEGGLVPTATEENARFVSALGGELAASIQAIDGVLDARVHIALPDTRRVALDDARPEARASVLVKYRGTTAPFEEDAIKALVAGAVQHLATENVAVVSIPMPPAAQTNAERLTSVGPFGVTRGSATPLKLTLAGALVLHLLLAGLLVFVVMRRRKTVAEPTQTE